MSWVRATIETDCNTGSIPLRGRLLQRLGSASLGFPDGKPHWFLHLREPDANGEYDIDDEFNSCGEAVDGLKALKDKGKDPDLYVISGPFVTTEDDAPLLDRAAPRSPSLAVVGPKVSVDTPLKRVVLEFNDAREPIPLDAAEYDALFWGRSSVHKFAVPYYVGAMGIKYGVRVSERFRGKKLDGTLTSEPPAYALIHEPDTEYSLLLDPTTGNTPVPLV